MGLFTKKEVNRNDNTAVEGPKNAPKADAKGRFTPPKIPRTVQQTLDWEEVYENGVFQIAPKIFSKTYSFKDVSFKTKSDEEQDVIYESYMRFLNLLQPDEDIFFTFVNTKEDAEAKLLSVLPPMRGDKNDVYREELKTVLEDNMKKSRKSIITSRYLTLVIKSDSVDDAMIRFSSIETEMMNNFKKVAGSTLEEITLDERLFLLNQIINGTDDNYWFSHDSNGKVKLDMDKMAKHGFSTKDVIAPASMKFKGRSFEIDNRYAQSMFLEGLANWMDSNFLPSLIAVNFESVFTMHITVLSQEDAIKKINNQSVNITAEVRAKQNANVKVGGNPEYISHDLAKAKEQVDELQEDIMNRDQRLFFMSFFITHFADSEQELKDNEQILVNSGAKFMCRIKPLYQQQERGFISSLPIGHDKLFFNRLLTTESLGVFIPFDEINQFDKNGIYYGINAINKTLIVYDRTKGQNFNGLILGVSGSGKSFSAKREMTSVILNKDTNVYIIDPDGEYTPLADSFDGTVVKISPGNGVYINPLDLDMDTTYDSDLNPLTMKTDFICGMLETMLGNGYSLTPIQKSIVDRCVQQIYRPYLEHLAELPPDKNGNKITIDRDYCPTLQNLFDTLLAQPQAEAQNLALVMETYTTGTFDTFAHRTNVNIENQLVIFDIINIGTNLKELALKVCMNEIWNKMVENRKKNKWTWFYCDEFHLLLKNSSTSEFLKSIWKRARKFYGVPTGITQNMEDLLNSPDARAIINNSSFVYMLNQSRQDREILKEILKLSDGDMEYVTNVDVGHGLIYTGNECIPFADKFPSSTKLYTIMSTKAKEKEEE